MPSAVNQQLLAYNLITKIRNDDSSVKMSINVIIQGEA